MLKSNPSVPQNRIIKEIGLLRLNKIIEIEPILSVWHPYKKRRLGQIYMEEKTVKTEREDGYLQDKEKSTRRSRPVNNLISAFQLPGL